MHHSHADNEKDLVLGLKNDDEAAFSKLYQFYSPRLMGRLMVLVKSEWIAADLLQETFVRLWKARRELDTEKSFRSYIFCIAENLVYDFFRRAARDIRLRNELLKYSDEEYLHIEEQMNRKEHAALLQSVIDELPFQRRQVFQLVKQDQRSYAEVSRLLDISPSTISDHIVKATKFIRSKLSSHHIISLIVFMLHK